MQTDPDPIFMAVTKTVRELFLSGNQDFPISGETNLIAEGICDSLGLIDLANGLESTIPGLRIHNAEITFENFSKINDICRFVALRVNVGP